MSLLMDALKKAEQAKKKASQDDCVVAVTQDDQSQSSEVPLTPVIHMATQGAQAEEETANLLLAVEGKQSPAPLKAATEVSSNPVAEDDLSKLEGLTLVDLSELDEELVVEFQGDKADKKTLPVQDEAEVNVEDTDLTLDDSLEKEIELSVKEDSVTSDSGTDEVLLAEDEGISAENDHDAITTLSAASAEPTAVGTQHGQKGELPDSAVLESTTATSTSATESVLKTEPSPAEPSPLESTLVEPSAVEETSKLITPPIVGVGANKRSRRQQVWSALIVAFLFILGGMFAYFNTMLDSEIQRASVFPVALPVEGQKTEQAVVDNVTQEPAIVVARVPVETIAKSSVITMAATPLPTASIATQPKKQAPSIKPLAPSKQSPNRASSSSTAIQITRAERRDPLEVILQEAYQAYQGGGYQLAEDKYRLALKVDADNRDARLGLAVIAQRTGRIANARRFYQSLLVLNPKDSIALTGLMSLPGNSGSKQNESDIKLLLDEEPTAAHLHFSLGIEYVAQGRWPEAQQSFFQAYRSAPENADYNYNLAVSLEQLSQPRAALDYYHRAKQLATGQLVGFSTEQLDQRIAKLGLRGEGR